MRHCLSPRYNYYTHFKSELCSRKGPTASGQPRRDEPLAQTGAVNTRLHGELARAPGPSRQQEASGREVTPEDVGVAPTRVRQETEFILLMEGKKQHLLYLSQLNSTTG